MSEKVFTTEEREVWLKNKIEYLADVFTSHFLFFALTPFTKDRPSDLTLKDILVRAFSTDNELKKNIASHMLQAGITQPEIDEIFVLFKANENEDGTEVESQMLEGENERKQSDFLPKLAGLIMAEAKREGISGLEVLDRAFAINSSSDKLKLIAAFQTAGLSWVESNRTVKEISKRLAKPSSSESDDDSQTGTGKSLPSGGWDDNA